MTATYWIKLYNEILYDPKMCRLDDHLWRRTIELFLLAGETLEDGVLPSLEDCAFKLRCEPEQLETDMVELQRIGIISVISGRYLVTHFSERQAANSPAERMRMMRERQKKQQYYGYEPAKEPVTIRNTEERRGEKRRGDSGVTAEQNVQYLLETIVGLPAIPADLPDMDELIALNIQEDDIRGALQWRKENGRGPVKRLSQLFPGIKVEYSKRVQDGNARGNGSKPFVPMSVEEENAAILRKAGLA